MCWHHWFDGAISSNIYLRRVFHVHDDEKGINYQTKVRRCETPSLTHFIKKTCRYVPFIYPDCRFATLDKGFGLTCHQHKFNSKSFDKRIIRWKKMILEAEAEHQGTRGEWDDLKRSEFQILWSLWSWPRPQWDKRRGWGSQWSEM